MGRVRRIRALRVHAYGASQWAWARERRWITLLAAAVVALATFLEISEELIEDGELLAFDEHILRELARLRRAWLTIPAIDITALGSFTLLGLVMLCAAIPLARMRDYRGALQLACAALGVAVWTLLTKHWFARARPAVVDHLMEVQGYSFPSGHSAGAAAVYVTLAMVLGRHVRSLGGRSWLVSAASALSLLIGLSRMYLGVHYPSDVASGLAFGAGWALLLTAAFEWWRRHADGAAQSSATTSSASDVASSP